MKTTTAALFILLLISCLPIHLRTTNTIIFPPEDSTATVLFEIKSPDTDYVSYLFGTHHAFGKDFFDELENAKHKLLNSDILIKENLNIPGHLAKDIINGRTTQTAWSKYLKKQDLQFIDNLFANSETDYHKITPTELHVFLNRYYKEKICDAKPSLDTSRSLDDYIGELASENNMELVGLETTEEQLEIIRKDVGMPRKVHKKRLARIIERLQAPQSADCSETEWYRNMSIDYQLEQPCQNTLMLTERNDKWMTTIVPSLKTSNCFIAVGLSHFMYECGLVNQLRGLGYSVTPIPVK